MQPDRAVRISKLLSLALRHDPAALEIELDAAGWTDVGAVLRGLAARGVVNDTCTIPRTLAARPVRELPGVTYFVFHRPRPRADAVDLVRALVEAASKRLPRTTPGRARSSSRSA